MPDIGYVPEKGGGGVGASYGAAAPFPFFLLTTKNNSCFFHNQTGTLMQTGCVVGPLSAQRKVLETILHVRSLIFNTLSKHESLYLCFTLFEVILMAYSGGRVRALW